MQKIGIFGGSFNPPHNGHINLATEMKKELKLDKVLIIPSGVSPHKEKSEISFDDRKTMCELAFGDLDGFIVSDIEGQFSGKSYTINTLRHLKKEYPENTMFYLIIGADMLFSFDKWYKYESILKECTVVSAARENRQYSDMLLYADEIGRIKVLNLKVEEISSSMIRKRIGNNQDISDFVPNAVQLFIKEKGFYV